MPTDRRPRSASMSGAGRSEDIDEANDAGGATASTPALPSETSGVREISGPEGGGTGLTRETALALLQRGKEGVERFNELRVPHSVNRGPIAWLDLSGAHR